AHRKGAVAGQLRVEADVPARRAEVEPSHRRNSHLDVARDGRQLQVQRRGAVDLDLTRDGLDLDAPGEPVEAHLTGRGPEGLRPAQVAGIDVRTAGVDRNACSVRHLDPEVGAGAATEQAHADVEAAALANLDPVVAELDVEDVRKRPVVQGVDPDGVALDTADLDVARRLA